MEITGRIINVLPAQSGVSNRTGNPWMSQEYVLETQDQYPRKMMFRIFVPLCVLVNYVFSNDSFSLLKTHSLQEHITEQKF